MRLEDSKESKERFPHQEDADGSGEHDVCIDEDRPRLCTEVADGFDENEQCSEQTDHGEGF
jgi:hypothetical protein